MTYTPDTELTALRGIGPQKAAAFARLGVQTLRGLLTLFPRRYEDRSRVCPIAQAQPDEAVCVHAMVAAPPTLAHIRRGVELVRVRVVDDSGALHITFFNQSYQKNRLRQGESYAFYGKVTVADGWRSMTNPVYEPVGRMGAVTGRVMPIYPLAAGLTQRNLRDAVRAALDGCADCLPDALPPEVAARYELAQVRFAYENIHFPANTGALELARRRLIFEELFVLATAMGRLRGDRTRGGGVELRPADPEVFYRALPFSPTGAQRRAVAEAARDLSSGTAMNRLVQGDVGSGKTLVAAACIWYAAQSGYQSAFMAPTELLAEQHEATLRQFLAPLGLSVCRLTGSMTAKQKRAVCEGLEAGVYAAVVGTHALLRDSVRFARLGLVITDEQHRFGVEQRAALAAKGERVHTLVMSATPIPRTLALMIYGDLDVSVIDELPPGRRPVETYCVDERYRARLTAFMDKLVGEGRQVFVVCPMVEESEALGAEVKSAEEHAAAIQRALPQRRVVCLHGRMKPKEKEAGMAAFAAGAADILVSTTVVEVGVDVPNAALMVVENAERFGLSQLHQLRGRVGRGAFQSYCVLVSDARSDEARARLRVMRETTDGFRIAEADLRQRGPGDFFGNRQHGLPELHVADLCTDMTVLQDAQSAAKDVLARDPELSAPEHQALRAQCARLFEANQGRLN